MFSKIYTLITMYTITINCEALEEPLLYEIDENVVGFVSEKDETSEYSSYNKEIDNYVKDNKKIQELFETWSKDSDISYDYFEKHFFKGLAYMDIDFRKLLNLKFSDSKSFWTSFERLMNRYKSEDEENYIASDIASSVYLVIRSTLSNSTNFEVSPEVLMTLLPILKNDENSQENN